MRSGLNSQPAKKTVCVLSLAVLLTAHILENNSEQMLFLLPSYSSQEYNDTEFIALLSDINDDPPLITQFYKCFCIWVNCTMLFLWENYSLNNNETAFYKRYILLICFTVMKWLTAWKIYAQFIKLLPYFKKCNCYSF